MNPQKTKFFTAKNISEKTFNIKRFYVKEYLCVVYNKRIELEEGDYYFNEQGYKVFTEQFHLRRGHCCKSGCKHCPYGYDKKTDSFK